MPKLIDLTGQKFGRLTVIEKVQNQNNKVCWKCICDCGQIVTRQGASLRSGRTLSCGCLKDEKHRKDLTNQKFGELTVIKYGNPIYEKSGDKIATWCCKCSCGNITEVSTANLISGATRSCGCLRRKTFLKMFADNDLTGKKFGKLIVLKRILDEKGTKYECLCECGNTKIIRGYDLSSGKTHSCGCIRNSIGEENIKKILKENNITFQTEYSFFNLPNRRFDFAIFNDNNELLRLIEFDGPQHYKETSYFNGSLSETQARDKEKNEYAILHNIPLVRIPYIERDKITLNLLFGNKYLINTARLMEERE